MNDFDTVTIMPMLLVAVGVLFALIILLMILKRILVNVGAR